MNTPDSMRKSIGSKINEVKDMMIENLKDRI